jgi:dTDP-4-amino-4,6-dideoxygalactose transaminase
MKTETAATQDAKSEQAAEPSFPFLDLKAQYATIRSEVTAAINRVMESQHFILGSEVKSLEEELAKYTGCRFGIGCASGSDALLLALMAYEIGPGDEVITTPFTFVATAGSVARLGARPVFVDIEPETFNLDPGQVAKAVTPRTRAIIPVHLFGLAAELAPILELGKQRGIPVIEDCAQAIGATYQGAPVGSLGAIGCFSFFPSKNLGGAGDGGMLATNDPALEDRLKVLRTHGGHKKYEYEVIGMNSRLDALQAAILRVKLPYLDRWAAARQRNADRYRTLFVESGLDNQVKLPVVPAGRNHIYNQFVICVEDRDALKEHLRQRGIPTEVYYPLSLHQQKAFAYLGQKEGDFPVAESMSRRVLALPVFPEITDQQLREVVAAVAGYYRRD